MLDHLETLDELIHAACRARRSQYVCDIDGLVARRRDFGELTFIDLRDREVLLR